MSPTEPCGRPQPPWRLASALLIVWLLAAWPAPPVLAAHPAKPTPGSAAPAPAEPVPAPAPPEAAPDQPPPADVPDTAPEPPPDPEEVKRSTPANSAEEMAWVNKKIAEDPFLKPFKPIGPAPEVKEFYNPLSRLEPELTPHLSSYLVQDQQGHVLGNLSMQVERVTSTLFGPVFHCQLKPDFSDRRQVDIWQSAVSGKPLRVLRTVRSSVASALPPAAGQAPEQVVEVQRLNASYLFDRVTVSKDTAAISGSTQERLVPYSFDLAQLPIVLTQLDYDRVDWPFEAALFDPATLKALPLQVNRPGHKTVLSAEPVSCNCWEVPVRLGNQQLTWYIERSSPQRLVKFQLGGNTYTLQQYLKRSGK